MNRIIYAFCLLVFVFGAAMVYRSGVVADNSKIITEFQQRVPRECYFEENSSALSEECIVVLNEQTAWMKKHLQYSFVVSGFAARAENGEDVSEEETRDYALHLGDRRAEMVKNYLIAQGIDEARISTVSFGLNAESGESKAMDRAKIRRTKTQLADLGDIKHKKEKK